MSQVVADQMELWQAQSQRLKTHPAQLYAKFESKEVRLCLVCRLLCLLRGRLLYAQTIPIRTRHLVI